MSNITVTEGTNNRTLTVYQNIIRSATTNDGHLQQSRGSDCTGTDGDTGRVLTLNNTSLTTIVQVWKGGRYMHSADITVAHNSTSSTVTFINEVYDDDYIEVFYFT